VKKFIQKKLQHWDSSCHLTWCQR